MIVEGRKGVKDVTNSSLCAVALFSCVLFCIVWRL